MPVNDLQRRILAHLSIPRNVDDLTNVIRPHAVVTDTEQPGRVRLIKADEVDDVLREDLVKQGWVKKLGRHEDAAALATLVQKDKVVMELPDEKAEIYARRMKRPDLAWRLQGDLWMLTEEGLAELHAPTMEHRTMTVSETQNLLNQEWARTLKGVSHENYNAEKHGSLAGQLLETEFTAWCKAVSDECERVWGERPIAPLAGGASGYSDAYEIALLDAENQKTALGAVVDPWFMALSILAFTDADTGTTADNGSHIPTYTGYARKSVAGTDMAAGSGSGVSVSNTSAIIFAGCTAGSSVILAVGNTSASTVGTLRKWGDITSTTISTTQTPAQFAVGAYTTTTT